MSVPLLNTNDNKAVEKAFKQYGAAAIVAYLGLLSKEAADKETDVGCKVSYLNDCDVLRQAFRDMI